jgi:hypothetical protein
MDHLYFPVIEQDDYEAFRSIMHSELPVTYREWLQRHADRVGHYRTEGRTIIEVKVKPNDFAAYLHARSHGANMRSLFDFTELFGKPNKN